LDEQANVGQLTEMDDIFKQLKPKAICLLIRTMPYLDLAEKTLITVHHAFLPFRTNKKI